MSTSGAPSVANLVDSAYTTYTSDPSDLNLEKLFKLLRQYARSITWNVLHGPNDEVAEEAAENVVLALSTFVGGSQFSTFAFAVIKNHIHSWLDKNSRRNRVEVSAEHLPPDDFAALSYDPHTDYHDRAALRAALDTLPRPNRVVVNLVLKGYTFAEVADQLTIPLGTAHARWQRSLNILQKKSTGTKKESPKPTKETEWKRKS